MTRGNAFSGRSAALSFILYGALCVVLPFQGGCFLAPCEPPETDDLDTYLKAEMACGGFPSLAAAIVKDGRVVWIQGYGDAIRESSVPASGDTLYMLASVSKTFTAAALLKLYEAGKLQLDDDINAYLPFSVRVPAAPDVPITFRMLLTHTSGLRDDVLLLDSLYVPGDSPIALGDFVRNYLTPEGAYYSASRNFTGQAPGTASEYSNVGATLVGYLVERIAGKPFDEYCREIIFEPLGMTNTSWRLADLDAGKIALPYEFDGLTYRPRDHYGYPDYPDGSLRTSAAQLARYALAHLPSGPSAGFSLLASETLALQRTPSPIAPDTGLGWFFRDPTDEPNSPATRTVFHTGGDYGVTTLLALWPDEDIGVIVLTNGSASLLFAPRPAAALPAIAERLYREAKAR